MVQQVGTDRLDSYGEAINHKMDFPIGNKEHGTLVQLDRANRPLPVFIVATRGPSELMANYAPLKAKSTAYEASRVVKINSGFVKGISGYNSGPAQWIQLHDAIAVPANAAIPDWIMQVPTLSNFSVAFEPEGYPMTTGIVICNSTTGPTKTLGAADCWFNVVYV